MNTKFSNVVEEMNNILKGQNILIACSTGVDSSVLLDLALKTTSVNRIVVAHVNHKKRQQSDIEEAYIREFCQQKGLICHVLTLPEYHGGSFQEWARNKRYEFFVQVMKQENLNYLLTAHHADDNLETIIMRFIKGSSLRGYAGISKTSKYDDYNIYRPLLNLSKLDIEEYANIENIQYYVDASNEEDDYTRNRIRKYIVPLMLKENMALYQAVDNYSSTLFETSKLLEDEINKFIKDEVLIDNNSISIKLSSFEKMTTFLKTEILFSILKPYELSNSCIKEIIKKISSTKNKIVSDINNELVFIKEYETINFISKKALPGDFYLKIEKDGEYILPNNRTIIVDKNICYLKQRNQELWYNIQRLPIIVRTRKDGDKIHLVGGTKTISNYLTDQKISHIERLKVLLICDEENKPMFIIK